MLGVGEADGAAGPRVAEGGRAGAHRRDGPGLEVAQRLAHWLLDDHVDIVGLEAGGGADTLLGEDADAVELAAVAQGGVHAGEGTRAHESAVGGEGGAADEGVVVGLGDDADGGGDGARNERVRRSRGEVGAGAVDERGDARLRGVVDTHVDAVQSEGRADLVLDELVDGPSVRAPDDLAEDPAEGVGVVARAGPRLPEGLEGGNGVAHVVPVGHELGGDAVGHLGDAGAVGERVADGGVLLAALGELGPPGGDGLVVGDDAAVHQHVDRGCGHALGARERREEGAAIDGAAGFDVGQAGPGIDDELAVVVGRHLQTRLDATGDKLLERGPDYVVDVRHFGPPFRGETGRLRGRLEA